LTYDDQPEIRELYKGFQIKEIELGYSCGSKRKAKEILIAPDGLIL
jgi:DNA adenine methylase